jgi:hypothetical protein
MTRTAPVTCSGSEAPTSPRPSPPAWAGGEGVFNVARILHTFFSLLQRFTGQSSSVGLVESSSRSGRLPLLGGEGRGEGGPTSILPALPRAMNFAESPRTTPR